MKNKTYSYSLVDPRDPNQIDKLPEAQGKVLACWYKPGPCHGDIIARLAEALGVDPAELVE